MMMLLSIAVALLAGLLMTRLMNRFHLPDVTAYLLAGVILGPCLLGRLGLPGLGFGTFEQVQLLQPISDVALGFIAFAIGSEFRLSHLRQTGGAAVTVGIIQAVVATIFVDLSLLGLHFVLGDKLPIPAVITLGAIAAATAPAATLMVVRQYKAKGPVTDLLLPVVALDDAVGSYHLRHLLWGGPGHGGQYRQPGGDFGSASAGDHALSGPGRVPGLVSQRSGGALPLQP